MIEEDDETPAFEDDLDEWDDMGGKEAAYEDDYRERHDET